MSLLVSRRNKIWLSLSGSVWAQQRTQMDIHRTQKTLWWGYLCFLSSRVWKRSIHTYPQFHLPVGGSGTEPQHMQRHTCIYLYKSLDHCSPLPCQWSRLRLYINGPLGLRRKRGCIFHVNETGWGVYSHSLLSIEEGHFLTYECCYIVPYQAKAADCIYLVFNTQNLKKKLFRWICKHH